MTAGQVLTLVRRLARRKDWTVEPLEDNRGRSRGKGSHQQYVLLDSTGTEVARFGVTGHAADMSWSMLRSLEAHLSEQFGEKRMEK